MIIETALNNGLSHLFVQATKFYTETDVPQKSPYDVKNGDRDNAYSPPK